PSGETLIFVPPVKEGRRVIVVFIGPTGTRTLPTTSRPSQAPRTTTVISPRARSQGLRCGARTVVSGARRRERWPRGTRMCCMAFLTAAGTRAIEPVCPYGVPDMPGVALDSYGRVVPDNGWCAGDDTRGVRGAGRGSARPDPAGADAADGQRRGVRRGRAARRRSRAA